MSKYILLYLLPSALAGSILYVSSLLWRPFLHKTGPAHRRGVLLLAGLLFLLPLPAVGAAPASQAAPPLQGSPAADIYKAGRTLGSALPATPSETGGAPALANAAPAQPAPGPAFPQAAGLVYAAGLAVSAGVLAVRRARVSREIRRYRSPVQDGELLALYHSLAGRMGLRRPPRLYRCSHLQTPVLAGVFHPAILLPEGEHQQEALEFALQHELTHYAQKDLLFKELLLLVNLLHWYHPLVYLLRREFNTVCEQNCDARVAASLSSGQRRAYAASLLHFAAPPLPGPLSAFASPAKKLKRRIACLLRPAAPKKSFLAVSALLLCLPVSAGILAGCGLADGANNSGGVSAPVFSSSAPAPPSGTEDSAASSAPDAGSIPASGPVSASIPEEAASTESGARQTSFLLPVPGGALIPKEEKAHRGIDLEAPAGAPVLAAAGGEVLQAGWHYSYGNFIELAHPGGIVTLYAHCQDLWVQQGDTVEQGQEIATVGSSGYSAGPHLHLEFLTDTGDLLAPLDYVKPAEAAPTA